MQKAKVNSWLNKFAFLLSLCLCVSVVNFKAQTGGTFDLSHKVIAAGGGSNSSGGNFRVGGTIGQPSAGTVSTNGSFSVRGGFWSFQSLAPTAASVSVSGSVTTADGQGIKNARLILTDSNGAIRATRTGSFGYYRFEELEVGQTYFLQISSKRFVFTNPTRILNVQDEISDANFVAEERWVSLSGSNPLFQSFFFGWFRSAAAPIAFC